MLPPVTHVLSVEMIRDGGSLAAVWSGGDGAEYWLFYPVKVESVDADRNRIAGWNGPQIHVRGTGVVHELSWQHAKVLIGQFRALVAKPHLLEVLDAMEEIAENSGSI